MNAKIETLKKMLEAKIEAGMTEEEINVVGEIADLCSEFFGKHNPVFTCYKGGKKIDWNAYCERLKNKTESDIKYVIEDCREALKAYPGSDNADFYKDEISYCYKELNKRIA